MDGLLEDFDYSGSFELDFSGKSEPDEKEVDDQEELESEESQEDESEVEESEETEESDSEELEDEDDEEISYSGIVDFLTEQGLIPEDLELEVEDSPEGLAQIFEATLEKKFDDMVGSLSPKAQKLLEVELNGGDIEEAFQEFNDINYEEVDTTDEDVRRELLTDYYKAINPKWSEAKITKKIETLFDLGDDEEEANEAKEFFVEQQELTRQEYLESLRKAKEEQEAYIQQELEEYHDIIDKVDNFNGLKFSSKKEKEEFRSYLFDRGKDGLTQAERDDLDKETRLAKEFYKFKKFSFETVKKQATTEAVVKLKKTATRFTDKNASSSRQENTRKTSGGFSLGAIEY